MTLLALATAARPGALGAFELDDLAEGMRVEIKLPIKGEQLRARRLTLKAEAGHELEVKAPVEKLLRTTVPAPTDTSAPVLSLLGRPVRLGGEVQVRGAADLSSLLTGLQTGQWIKIRCRDRGDELIMHQITLRSQTAGRAEIEGPIDRLQRHRAGRARIEIGGFRIEINERTTFAVDAEELPGYVTSGAGGKIPSALTGRAVDDDDARPRGVRLANGRIELGGQLGWQLEPETEFDLDPALAGDQTSGQVTGQFEAAARLHRSLAGFVRVALSRVIGVHEPQGIDLDDGVLRLREAHLTWSMRHRRLPGETSLQIGRQDFDEQREWLYDENLDAARLGWRGPRQTTLSAAVAGYLSSDHPIDQHVTYRLVTADTRVRRGVTLGAYAITRLDPTERDDDARWVGLRSLGSARDGVTHWLELGWQRGQQAGRKHRGRAFDLGVTLEPLDWFGHAGGALARWRPACTLGFATGSGDTDPSDDVMRTYRQTGLEDNNDRFAGVTSFRYYGELLDPELTNLRVATVGLGVRPLRSSSIDLVYHRYRQDHPDNRLRGADIGREPSGMDPHLGSEIDLVIGYEEVANLEIEFNLARFEPGAAFDGDTATAYRARLQARYNF